MNKVLILGVVVAAVAGTLLAPLPFDLTTTIDNEIDIARPPAAVFDYVTTPGNWPKWHPSSLAVHGPVDHPLTFGERVTEDFRVAGREGRAEWTVVAREAPTNWQIDGAVDGRPAGRVSYTLTPTTGGTRFHRRLTYVAPNLLFAALDRVTIRKRVAEESGEAVRRLKHQLESASP
jgi:uncharacterized protein YndB with AHSA1/START domain